MRLNLYTWTCSLLAYGVTALSIGNMVDTTGNLEHLVTSPTAVGIKNNLSQSYSDDYALNLAQTYYPEDDDDTDPINLI